MLYIDLLDYKYSYKFNQYATITVNNEVRRENNNISLSGCSNGILYKVYFVKLKKLYRFRIIDYIRYYKFANREMPVLWVHNTKYHPYGVVCYNQRYMMFNGRLYNTHCLMINSVFNEIIKND